MVYAEDDSVKKKDEKNNKEVINLSQVVVQVASQSIIGIDQGLGASEVGKSTLNQTQLDIIQDSNMASVLDKMPGAIMGGSPRLGGQVLNIWGMSDTQSVPIMVYDALKTFGKYRQGTLFVDPDLIKEVTVNKGAFSPEIGNGGFGGNVQLTTKDAKDFLEDNQNLGASIKYGHHSNNDQNNYTAAIYGQTKNQVIDGLIYYTNSQSNDVRLADREKYHGSSIDQYSYLAKSNIYLGEEAKLTLSAGLSERQAKKAFEQIQLAPQQSFEYWVSGIYQFNFPSQINQYTWPDVQSWTINEWQTLMELSEAKALPYYQLTHTEEMDDLVRELQKYGVIGSKKLNLIEKTSINID